MLCAELANGKNWIRCLSVSLAAALVGCGTPAVDLLPSQVNALSPIEIPRQRLATTTITADWVEVGPSRGSSTLFIDKATVPLGGSVVTMFVLYDYASGVNGPAGASFRSMKDHNEYDCAARRSRTLLSSWYSENIGRGELGTV